MSGTARRTDPFPSFHFRITIQGGASYQFKSCSGLRTETKVDEIFEGGRNDSTRKLVGQTTYSNIVLKQGFADGISDLYKLRENFLKSSSPKRFNFTIQQLGPSGREARWIVRNAWICKWEGPDFDAAKNEISIESIEIAHEGFEFDGGGGFGGGSGGNPFGGLFSI